MKRFIWLVLFCLTSINYALFASNEVIKINNATNFTFTWEPIWDYSYNIKDLPKRHTVYVLEPNTSNVFEYNEDGCKQRGVVSGILRKKSNSILKKDVMIGFLGVCNYYDGDRCISHPTSIYWEGSEFTLCTNVVDRDQGGIMSWNTDPNIAKSYCNNAFYGSSIHIMVWAASGCRQGRVHYKIESWNGVDIDNDNEINEL